MSRLVRTALVAVALSAACGEKVAEAPEAAATPVGHRFTDAASGVGLDLPTVWAGRYRVSDSIVTPTRGLQRELAFRFVRADSTIVAVPLIVMRVFDRGEWSKIPADAVNGLFGTVIASDEAHVVTVRPAAGNPLASGSADALAFDSLMMVVLQHPLRTSLPH